MAFSSTHSCFSSAFLTSSIKNQERSLFRRSKIDLISSSHIFAGSRVLQMKCFNGHLIPVENDFGDSSTVDGPVKHFKVSPDHFSSPEQNKTTVSVTVVGASGDLAKKKIFPALFALYYEDFLPEHFTVFGYARSKMSDEELRNMISKTLTCRIDKRENCGDKMEKFLQRCFYQSGQYDSEENFKELDEKLKEKEVGRLPNRLFYLSIPPNIFIDVVRCASHHASSPTGWTRVIVEKPFGRDSDSSRELTTSLKQYLTEDQIFRIDHYLGKELVENLSVLRFSNLVFEPLWSRQYIRNVQLIFSEDFGTEGRGGYFDRYGIIRDIMQNHLLQILALFAMETPVSLDAEDIRNEKVKVLKSMRPLQIDDAVIGQYKGHSKGGKSYPSYTDDPTVPNNSLTPTFAAAAMFIDNARWDGVPFLMKAGKALHSNGAEIRVQFRHVPGNLYRKNFGTYLDKNTNELVIRVQPNEAIYLKINNKVPGLGMRLDRSNLNLLYSAKYSREIPDAYERLLLDAIEGERRLFIRSDELDAAWALFTPLLKELEEKHIAPELYPYGSRGPVGAHYLAAKYNVSSSSSSRQLEKKMGSIDRNLKILFFPFFAPGHMLPMVDMAKLFASRGIEVTILTTQGNSSLIHATIDRFNSSAGRGSPIRLHLIPFPSAAVGLPEGCESVSSLSSYTQIPKIIKATGLLRNSFDHVLKDLCPDCVVTDVFLPWTYEVATENGIPRIMFEGSNFFAACCLDSIERHKLLEGLPSEAESFVLPGLPHHIEMLRSQVFDPNKMTHTMIHMIELIKHVKEVAPKSYGLVANSFYEMEPGYVEYYRKVIGRKAWQVGPVTLCNKEEVDKSERGGGNRGDEYLKWLDGRKSRSVVYMCFGSISDFTAAQLREMAFGLESSGHPFVWVVRNMAEEWIPEGYEERIKGFGLIIKGWAPQLLILNHAAVGCFITHCGWNSSLEGITAGLPMGTWPLAAEQFFNERLLVDVLKIGVAVGSKVFGMRPEDRPVVNAAALEAAVRSLMGEGEEAAERRRRARELKEMARKAMEEGGSSYNDLGNLIQELIERKAQVV